MKKSNAPPPIAPVRNKPFKIMPSPPVGMKEIELRFRDPFAPSFASYYSTSDDGENSVAAHLFYNQQLYDTMSVAIGDAISAGLPQIDHNFPLTYAYVSDDSLRLIYMHAYEALLKHSEGTYTWLCIQCYMRWVLLCHSLSIPAEASFEVGGRPAESSDQTAMRQRAREKMHGLDHAFFLGAALRELELVVLNKRDAIRGKKTAQSAKAGGQARKGATEPETMKRLSAMKGYLDSGHKLSTAARLVAVKFGGTPGANSKLWTRYQKK